MKCSKCHKSAKLQTTTSGNLCLKCIMMIEDTLEPKFPWKILRNTKEILKGRTNKRIAYVRYSQEAATKGFVRWLWKEAYYEDKKGNRLILKFDKPNKQV